MKELEVTLTIRNNRLKKRRLALGLSQRALAKKLGIPPTTYNGLETMRFSPTNKKGSWGILAKKISDFYKIPPIELFPDAIRDLKIAKATREVDIADLPNLLSSHQQKLLDGPEEALQKKEFRTVALQLLEGLSPKQKDVLKRRFGFDGPSETLGEIGGGSWCTEGTYPTD